MLGGSLPDGKRIMQDKISKSKHQIPIKFQIPIFNDQKKEVWSAGGGLVIVYGICNLLFGIFTHSNIPIPPYANGARHLYRQSH
jgi:hypothetical protein